MKLRGIQNIFIMDGPDAGLVQHLWIGCPICDDCNGWPVTISTNSATYKFVRELDEYRAMAEYSLA